MTYQEAMQHVLTVRWKTGYCNQGEQCWCRTIVPEEAIKVEDEEIFVAPYGIISREHAEHIVRLHNDQLTKK